MQPQSYQQNSRLFQAGSQNRSPLRGSSFSRNENTRRTGSYVNRNDTGNNTKAENSRRSRMTRRASSRDRNESSVDRNDYTKAENYRRARMTRRASSRDRNDSMYEERDVFYSDRLKDRIGRADDEEDDFSWIEERERMSAGEGSSGNQRYSWQARARGDSSGSRVRPVGVTYNKSRSQSLDRNENRNGGASSGNSSRSQSRDRYESGNDDNLPPGVTRDSRGRFQSARGGSSGNSSRSQSRDRYENRDGGSSGYDRYESRTGGRGGSSGNRSRSGSRDRYENRDGGSSGYDRYESRTGGRGGNSSGYDRYENRDDGNSSGNRSRSGSRDRYENNESSNRSQLRSSNVSWRPIRSSNVSSNCRHEAQWSPCGRQQHAVGCACYRCKAHAHNEKLSHTFVDKTSVSGPCGTENTVYTKKDLYTASSHARGDMGREDEDLQEALDTYNAWAVKNNAPELTMEDVRRTQRMEMRGGRYEGRSAAGAAAKNDANSYRRR